MSGSIHLQAIYGIFFKIDESNQGWSFFKNQKDRKISDRRSKIEDCKIEKSKDQIPNPANWYYDQGWEFDHQFFDQIDRYLWSKDRFDCEKDWIAPVDIF